MSVRRRQAPSMGCGEVRDTAWDHLDLAIKRVSPLADAEEFDPIRGPPVVITRPLAEAPAHAGWSSAASLLAYARERVRDGRWKLTMARVPARGAPDQGVMRPSDEKWDESKINLEHIPNDAAYIQLYFGKGTAQAVIDDAVPAGRAGLPCGPLPLSLKMRYTPRSLIIFLSVGTTMSDTHSDETASILYCVVGSKVLYLAPPLAPTILGLKRTNDQQGRFLNYDPFADPMPSTLWQRITLLPGESVLIPQGWWHNVYSTPGTIALSMEVTKALSLRSVYELERQGATDAGFGFGGGNFGGGNGDARDESAHAQAPHQKWPRGGARNVPKATITIEDMLSEAARIASPKGKNARGRKPNTATPAKATPAIEAEQRVAKAAPQGTASAESDAKRLAANARLAQARASRKSRASRKYRAKKRAETNAECGAKSSAEAEAECSAQSSARGNAKSSATDIVGIRVGMSKDKQQPVGQAIPIAKRLPSRPGKTAVSSGGEPKPTSGALPTAKRLPGRPRKTAIASTAAVKVEIGAVRPTAPTAMAMEPTAKGEKAEAKKASHLSQVELPKSQHTGASKRVGGALTEETAQVKKRTKPTLNSCSASQERARRSIGSSRKLRGLFHCTICALPGGDFLYTHPARQGKCLWCTECRNRERDRSTLQTVSYMDFVSNVDLDEVRMRPSCT